MLVCILNCAYFFNRRNYFFFLSDFMMALRSVGLSSRFEMSSQPEISLKSAGRSILAMKTGPFGGSKVLNNSRKEFAWTYSH